MYERDFDSLEADPAEEGKRHWMALIDWLRVKAFPELTVARYVEMTIEHNANVQTSQKRNILTCL